MEMQKSYYVVTYKPAYLALLQTKASDASPAEDDANPPCVIVSITQGGFGR